MNDIIVEQIRNHLTQSAKGAIVAINKDSRIQTHLRNMVVMHNIMRVFLIEYEIDDNQISSAQRALYNTLQKQSVSQKRSYSTEDKICFEQALDNYNNLIESASVEQLLYVVGQLQLCFGIDVDTYIKRKAVL